MVSTCWGLWEKHGFLLQPNPLSSLNDLDHALDAAAADHIESLADDLPALLSQGTIREILDDLPIYTMQPLLDADCRLIERAFQIYSYLATAYVHASGQPTASHIPAGVAVPLVALSEKVVRPPILAYASYTLANWQLIDPDDTVRIDNLRLVQQMTDLPDADWFTRVHVEVEAQASPAIRALPQLSVAIRGDNTAQIIALLETISHALQAMQAALKRMPEGCQPHVYYEKVRPYMFGFDDVVYEGVPEYEDKPQSFRGETGAQSSIIPALVQGLGIRHEQSGLTEHLRIMRDYMPREHRRFIHRLDPDALRAYIQKRHDAELREAYDAALDELLAFRKLHLRFAISYIFNQNPESTGTGGTDFKLWLQQLIDETEQHYLA